MSRRHRIRYGQLAASQATLVAMTGLLLLAARGVDGPARAVWAPVLGAVLATWTFAIIWALIAVAFTIRATLREVRSAVTRPRPGTDGRPAAALADLIAAADEWRADEPADVPPVDPDAMYKPRGTTFTEAWIAKGWLEPTPAEPVDEYLAEARHARQEAAA